MAGGITTLRSFGFLALAIAGCSGRVQPESDDPGDGGAAHGGRDGAPGTHNGETSGADGATHGGAGGSGGANSGGGADICKGEPLMSASLSFGVRVDMPTVCSVGGPNMCKFTAAQHLEGYDCSADAGAIPWVPPYLIRKVHTVGCGNETVSWGGGKGERSETFSLATGERVGASRSLDAYFGPCNTSLYVAGQNPRDCPDADETVCVARALTGDAGANEECTESQGSHLLELKARPECECSGDPGVGTCLGLESCECWCSLFVRAARACAGISW